VQAAVSLPQRSGFEQHDRFTVEDEFRAGLLPHGLRSPDLADAPLHPTGSVQSRRHTGTESNAWPGGAVRLLSYTGSRTYLDVASRGWNLLVTSDASWPGWRITWNGARLAPVLVNGAFLGVFLPPGKGVIELRYRPREFDLGLALAGGALLALAAGLAVSRLYRRRRGGDARPKTCTC
jgi:hypothetical protein